MKFRGNSSSGVRTALKKTNSFGSLFIGINDVVFEIERVPPAIQDE